MPLDQELGVSDEVADVIDQQPGASIKEVVQVSARPGWSSTFTGHKLERLVHIRLLRSVREDAFRAQEERLNGVLKYIALTELPSPLSTGERFLAIRERQDRTLAKALPKLRGAESPSSLKLRTVVLRNVVAGISSLHSVKAVHGDVKPDNIAISKDGSRVELMDFGSPMPQRQLHDDEVPYRGPGRGGTYGSDIFAFGTLIYDLTHDLRMNVVLEQIGFSARQLLWLSEVARWEVSRDRPDAETLFAVLFDRDAFWMTATENIRDAGNDLLRLLNRHNSDLISLGQLTEAKQLVTRRAIEGFYQHPETMVYAQRGNRLVSLLANVSIDSNLAVSHTHKHENESDVSGEFITTSERTIDDEFRELIERDLRRNYAELDSEAFSTELQEATSFFNQLREQLLSEANYFDEDGLARLMSRHEDLGVSSAEVATLRQWGDLIAVPDHEKWLYPDFQFDPEVGAPYAVIKDVSQRFSRDENPWAILSWWLSPHPRLGGLTPADALTDEDLRGTLPMLVAAAS